MDDPDEIERGGAGGEAAAVPELGLKETPIAVWVVVGLSTFMVAYYSLGGSNFTNPMFVGNQMMMNFFLLIVVSSMYGLMTLVLSKENPINAYRGVMLPVVLVGTMWFKSYFGYAGMLTMHCTELAGPQDPNSVKSVYRPSILAWNTAKIAIAILVTFLFTSLFSWTITPFYELFGSPHPMVYFFAIGFWTGCATWAAETSCYFGLRKDGCVPLERISSADLKAAIKS